MKTTPTLPTKELTKLGQSIWIDDLRRRFLSSGELSRWIAEDGVTGITSNPAIFQKAIATADDYDSDIRALATEGKETSEIYEAMAVLDIRHAADMFRDIYDQSEGRDGYVSLEVSPHLANDTQGTVAEARRLWQAVGRPNVFIKVPATRAGLPAIWKLLTEGINVNITLLFGLQRYWEVAETYLAATEERLKRNQPLEPVASVASFFLSRIDVMVDPKLDSDAAKPLRGEVAVACAKLAYQTYLQLFASERFQKLAAKGARPQRLLWASTSTKNPDYPDTKYVEPLIGPNTINTMPLETLEAYRDHGQPANRLEQGTERARATLKQLNEVGIDLDQIARQLEAEGIEKFVKPFDQLMATLKDARDAAVEEEGLVAHK